MKGFWARWLLRLGVLTAVTAPFTPFSLKELQRLGLPVPDLFELPFVGVGVVHDTYFHVNPALYLMLVPWAVPFLASFERFRGNRAVALLSIGLLTLTVLIHFGQAEGFLARLLAAFFGIGFIVAPAVEWRHNSLASGGRLARLLLGLALSLMAVSAAFQEGWRIALWFGAVSLFFGGLAIAAAEILWKSPIPSAGDTMAGQV